MRVFALLIALIALPAAAQFAPNQVLRAADLNAALSAPTIKSGTIDGAPIGVITPATGAFTSLTSGTITATGLVTANVGFKTLTNMTYTKVTDPLTAPGAGYLKLLVVAGTTGGSCKIIAYAGTSTTPVTLIDNVGSGC